MIFPIIFFVVFVGGRRNRPSRVPGGSPIKSGLFYRFRAQVSPKFVPERKIWAILVAQRHCTGENERRTSPGADATPLRRVVAVGLSRGGGPLLGHRSTRRRAKWQRRSGLIVMEGNASRRERRPGEWHEVKASLGGLLFYCPAGAGFPGGTGFCSGGTGFCPGGTAR